ncbi:MAG: hypothetical protein IT462_08745 [Planctomycetes bacterium]|nr:hypothetical protein [Planctomycetota bacterium]
MNRLLELLILLTVATACMAIRVIHEIERMKKRRIEEAKRRLAARDDGVFFKSGEKREQK